MNINKRRVKEFRAEPLKGLVEQRAELLEALNAIVEKAKAETRAISDEEQESFDELESKIKAIDATIEAEKRATELEVKEAQTKKEEADEEEDPEVRAFENFLRNTPELRTGEIQLTQGLNGAIVPTKIADRIIKAVKDRVPFLQKCDVVYTNGKLSVPVYGEDSTNKINASYVDEGSSLVDNIGKFATVDLTGYVIGALSLVSNKLITNTDFDIVSFVVNQVAEAMADKLENEFVNGTENKITGVVSARTGVTCASATAITYDELLTLKHSVKQRFQQNAIWTMHPDTYTAICKLKDGNNIPYFKEADYKIFDKEVWVSDNFPTIAAGGTAIVYGDMTGYTIKAAKSVEIQVLRERFAEKNMTGVIAFSEYDAKITDSQKIAKMVMHSA